MRGNKQHTAYHLVHRLKRLYQLVRMRVRGRNLLAIKYLLAFLPIAWILLRIDFGRLRHALATTESWVIPVMVLLAILLMFLQGFKWWVLLRAFIPHLSLSEVLSCHFKGIYYSMFLPTSAAQDIVRTVLLSRNNDYGIAWGATWLTRISGLIIMLLLSLYGVISIDAASAPPGMTAIVLTSAVGVVLMTVMSFSKRFTRLFRSVFVKISPVKVISAVEHIRDGIYRYRHKRACLLTVILITIATQVLFVVNAIFIIRGITGRFYIAECFMYIPLIEIICLSVPLTPNGIGIRDALSALMFHRIGLPAEQLGTYVLLGLGVVVLKSVGGVPLLYEWVAGTKKRSC
jgi:uncharacterized protein (TIRG00374 family)